MFFDIALLLGSQSLTEGDLGSFGDGLVLGVFEVYDFGLWVGLDFLIILLESDDSGVLVGI